MPCAGWLSHILMDVLTWIDGCHSHIDGYLTVEFEIGFITEHYLILFLTYILKCSNPLWLASFQTLEFAYLPALECCM